MIVGKRSKQLLIIVITHYILDSFFVRGHSAKQPEFVTRPRKVGSVFSRYLLIPETKLETETYIFQS